MNKIEKILTPSFADGSSGSICFPYARGVSGKPGVELFETGLKAVGLNKCEVWAYSGAMESGVEGRVRWVRMGEQCLLFAKREVTPSSMSEVSKSVYMDILSLAEQLGSPHLLRVWNYVPDINSGTGDAENYKQFCLGRKIAFDEKGVPANGYPAASALGSEGRELVVYALAGVGVGRHFENPNQVSAYKYPRKYGPESPSFARATLVESGEERKLYFSGTASVIGHESVKIDDVAGQVEVTLDNLESLFAHVESELGRGKYLKPDLFKVYLRNSEDHELLSRMIADRFPAVQVVLLKADICRKELLIEIDGHCLCGDK